MKTKVILHEMQFLVGYIIPLAMFVSLYFKGYTVVLGLMIAFFIIPILELFFKGNTQNMSPEEEQEALLNPFFDLVLYLHLPLFYLALVCYLYTANIYFTEYSFSAIEMAFLTITMGVILGAMGINIGHELGHRSNKMEQTIAQLLLLPNFYMHFFIEHNRGHHLNIATDKDPASSKKNEIIYFFFLRSMIGGYLSAWHLEADKLRKEGKSFWSIHNMMLWFQLFQLLYLGSILIIFSWKVAILAVIAGVIGILSLETVNYIEHYGLRRKLLPSGYYEKVQPYHSWNSNHTLGRIFLFELTRHSDHHFKASRKYQTLRHFDESPQLPLGYPGSMICAMIPPLWFWLMNPLVEEIEAKNLVVEK
jgi:alkane 1-monooxygenase